ncbi:MAG: hypothetical protein ACYDHP_08960 [Ferrimicrobium sp.]
MESFSLVGSTDADASEQDAYLGSEDVDMDESRMVMDSDQTFWGTLERVAGLQADLPLVQRPQPVDFGGDTTTQAQRAPAEPTQESSEDRAPREVFSDIHRLLGDVDGSDDTPTGAEQFLDSLERKNRTFERTGEMDMDLDRAAEEYERDSERVWRRGQDDIVSKRRIFHRK